jgi:hypothetical protein
LPLAAILIYIDLPLNKSSTLITKQKIRHLYVIPYFSFMPRCGLALNRNYLTGRATLIFRTAEQQKNNDNYYKATKAASTSKAAESAKFHMCASHP